MTYRKGGNSMKYENAKDVLPEELFEKVQKYASGKLLYFPISGERRGRRNTHERTV